MIAVTRSGRVPELWKGPLMDRVQVVRADLGRLGSFDAHSIWPVCTQIDHIDYILHCAAITDSSQMVARPVETIRSIVNATQDVLELACHYQIRSMVYLSSMEVYGSLDCPDGKKLVDMYRDMLG